MTKNYKTLKQRAIKLRKQGKSLRQISSQINIAKSTTSLWLKSVKLNSQQQNILDQNWKKGLVNARKQAVKSHRLTKLKRINKINREASIFLNSLSIDDKILELFLSGLYLGDGFKIYGRTALGSSNPKILKTFITLIRKLYKIKESKLRAAIYARADQKPQTLINYWSKFLSIPKKQFHKTQIDKRTLNKKSYPHYKGVCAVNYFDIKLQRRILAISSEMIEYINNLEP